MIACIEGGRHEEKFIVSHLEQSIKLWCISHMSCWEYWQGMDYHEQLPI